MDSEISWNSSAIWPNISTVAKDFITLKEFEAELGRSHSPEAKRYWGEAKQMMYKTCLFSTLGCRWMQGVSCHLYWTC